MSACKPKNLLLGRKFVRRLKGSKIVKSHFFEKAANLWAYCLAPLFGGYALLRGLSLAVVAGFGAEVEQDEYAQNQEDHKT